MRPITSGIGSAPNRIAGTLARHLSPLLGTISEAHLKHSGDLLDRIRDITTRDKKLASLDVKSLFTCIPSDNVIELLRDKIKNGKIDLSMPPNEFVDWIQLFVEFNYFKFQGHCFHQKFGITIGSPLSANMFMKFLKAGPFADIVPEYVS
ncbi:uncharacterized protein LOC143019034 [Oratosquilla oratoria]|uniref:uncharacterized protein LOC143019034 n=1 Tax=Oratosquilla oratoria TaxID=337810 RepID=UPI003F762A10